MSGLENDASQHKQDALPDGLLLELNNASELFAPVRALTRVKYTCLAVSTRYLALGANTGGLYIFSRTNSWQYLTLITNRDGVGPLLAVAFSPNDNFVGVCFAKQVSIWELNLDGRDKPSRVKSTVCEHQVPITCLTWDQYGARLFSGDDHGVVSVTYMPPNKASRKANEACKNRSFRSDEIIYRADGTVVQLDFKRTTLLVSSRKHCYVLDTQQEKARQLGQKPRDGTFGGCLRAKERNGGDLLVFTARPGARLWQALVSDMKVSTHKLKEVLQVAPRQFLGIALDAGERLPPVDLTSVPLVFSSLHVVCERFLVLANRAVLCVYDPDGEEAARLLHWRTFADDITFVQCFANEIYVAHGPAGASQITHLQCVRPDDAVSLLHHHHAQLKLQAVAVACRFSAVLRLGACRRSVPLCLLDQLLDFYRLQADATLLGALQGLRDEAEEDHGEDCTDGGFSVLPSGIVSVIPNSRSSSSRGSPYSLGGGDSTSSRSSSVASLARLQDEHRESKCSSPVLPVSASSSTGAVDKLSPAHKSSSMYSYSPQGCSDDSDSRSDCSLANGPARSGSSLWRSVDASPADLHSDDSVSVVPAVTPGVSAVNSVAVIVAGVDEADGASRPVVVELASSSAQDTGSSSSLTSSTRSEPSVCAETSHESAMSQPKSTDISTTDISDTVVDDVADATPPSSEAHAADSPSADAARVNTPPAAVSPTLSGSTEEFVALPDRPADATSVVAEPPEESSYRQPAPATLSEPEAADTRVASANSNADPSTASVVSVNGADDVATVGDVLASDGVSEGVCEGDDGAVASAPTDTGCSASLSQPVGDVAHNVPGHSPACVSSATETVPDMRLPSPVSHDSPAIGKPASATATAATVASPRDVLSDRPVVSVGEPTSPPASPTLTSPGRGTPQQLERHPAVDDAVPFPEVEAAASAVLSPVARRIPKKKKPKKKSRQPAASSGDSTPVEPPSPKKKLSTAAAVAVSAATTTVQPPGASKPAADLLPAEVAPTKGDAGDSAVAVHVPDDRPSDSTLRQDEECAPALDKRPSAAANVPGQSRAEADFAASGTPQAVRAEEVALSPASPPPVDSKSPPSGDSSPADQQHSSTPAGLVTSCACSSGEQHGDVLSKTLTSAALAVSDEPGKLSDAADERTRGTSEERLRSMNTIPESPAPAMQAIAQTVSVTPLVSAAVAEKQPATAASTAATPPVQRPLPGASIRSTRAQSLPSNTLRTCSSPPIVPLSATEEQPASSSSVKLQQQTGSNGVTPVVKSSARPSEPPAMGAIPYGRSQSMTASSSSRPRGVGSSAKQQLSKRSTSFMGISVDDDADADVVVSRSSGSRNKSARKRKASAETVTEEDTSGDVPRSSAPARHKPESLPMTTTSAATTTSSKPAAATDSVSPTRQATSPVARHSDVNSHVAHGGSSTGSSSKGHVAHVTSATSITSITSTTSSGSTDSSSTTSTGGGGGGTSGNSSAPAAPALQFLSRHGQSATYKAKSFIRNMSTEVSQRLATSGSRPSVHSTAPLRESSGGGGTPTDTSPPAVDTQPTPRFPFLVDLCEELALAQRKLTLDAVCSRSTLTRCLVQLYRRFRQLSVEFARFCGREGEMVDVQLSFAQLTAQAMSHEELASAVHLFTLFADACVDSSGLVDEDAVPATVQNDCGAGEQVDCHAAVELLWEVQPFLRPSRLKSLLHGRGWSHHHLAWHFLVKDNLLDNYVEEIKSYIRHGNSRAVVAALDSIAVSCQQSLLPCISHLYSIHGLPVVSACAQLYPSVSLWEVAALTCPRAFFSQSPNGIAAVSCCGRCRDQLDEWPHLLHYLAVLQDRNADVFDAHLLRDGSLLLLWLEAALQQRPDSSKLFAVGNGDGDEGGADGDDDGDADGECSALPGSHTLQFPQSAVLNQAIDSLIALTAPHLLQSALQLCRTYGYWLGVVHLLVVSRQRDSAIRLIIRLDDDRLLAGQRWPKCPSSEHEWQQVIDVFAALPEHASFPHSLSWSVLISRMVFECGSTGAMTVLQNVPSRAASPGGGSVSGVDFSPQHLAVVLAASKLEVQQQALGQTLLEKVDMHLWSMQSSALAPGLQSEAATELSQVLSARCESSDADHGTAASQSVLPSLGDTLELKRPVRWLECASTHWGVSTSLIGRDCACCSLPLSETMMDIAQPIAVFSCGHGFHRHCVPEDVCVLCFGSGSESLVLPRQLAK